MQELIVLYRITKRKSLKQQLMGDEFKDDSAIANTTTAAAGQPGYYITQVFVPWSPTPTVPCLVRCEVDATVRDVALSAIEKLRGIAVLPSSVDAVEILGAQGDGNPDFSSPPLAPAMVLRSSGLAFPYMLVMICPEAENAALLAASRADQASREGYYSGEGKGGEDGLTAMSAPNQTVAANAIPSDRYLSAKEEYLGRLAYLEDIAAKRSKRVAQIEQERYEKERRHLEWCEEREIARREEVKKKKIAAEKKAYEVRREQELRDLEAQRAQEAKKREQDRLLEQHREEMHQQQADRERRALELDQQRKLKKLVVDAQQETTQAAAIEPKSQGTRSEVLSNILQSLHISMETDAKKQERELEEQRRVRAQQEQAMLEAQYVARLEEARKAERAIGRQNRIQQKIQREESKREEEVRTLAKQVQAQREEAERKQAWLAKRSQRVDAEIQNIEQAAILLNKRTPNY